ncbi:MAG: restriction endonuclease subunit S [Gluconobacter cerinus]|uniref:restriction endonuclease subunit S n=1 Tax=Gluconobacter cerinus TaxID=38307 RepID=UPI0039E7A926
MNSSLLADLLEFTRDGEWGKGEPGPGLVEMGVIRGTDFANIRRGDLSSIPVRYIPEKVALRKQLQANDILFETAGGTKDQPTGRSVFIPERLIKGSPRPLTCASFARFLRADTAKIEPRFLFWYLQYLWNERLIYQYHIQHTGVARFQYTQFASEQRVPYGDREEQVNIATTLAALDDKIELNRKTAATLEEMARALYRSWFVDFDPVRARAEGRAPAHMDAATAALFPDSFGEDGLPVGWQFASIYEVARVQYGAPFASAKFNTSKEGRPLVRIRDLKSHQPGVWTTEVLRNEFLIRPGDIVVGMDGDFTPFTWCSSEALMNQRVCCFVPGREHDRAFVRLCISGLLKTEAEAAVATTVIHLGKKDIDKFQVPLASQEVMAAFSGLALPWHRKVVALGLENHTLASLRDTLLPRLMSGELRVGAACELIEAVA